MNKQELKDKIELLALKYWEERGALYGSIQCASDIRLDPDAGIDIPERLKKPGAAFETHAAAAEVKIAAFSGCPELRITLWVRPVLKSGQLGEQIRFAWIRI